ncbi:MAG: hypothetical protein MUD01_01810, partial [Chloroflexaceae bacterium]|nr:hypothetical protein [Chloroflexaceae bacterium]
MQKLSLILLALVLAVGLIQPGQAQESNRAGLVVRYGDGSVQTACVRFPEEQITGLDMLARSGIPYIAQQGGIGAAVCKIGNEGCDYPAEDCFCKRDGPRSIFWSYHTLVEGSWRFSNLGAANVLEGRA